MSGTLTLRNVDAIVVGNRNAPKPVADLCTGTLSIAPGEVRLEPHTERVWTGPIPASDARPVAHHASTIELVVATCSQTQSVTGRAPRTF